MTKKIGLFLLVLLTPFICLQANDKTQLTSHFQGTEWARNYAEQYPEMLWLANDKVRKTEEGQAAVQGTYSEQLFGQKFIEFDRTIMTLHCLQLILDGSEKAYCEFTAAQPTETKLSRSSFEKLHLKGVELLKSQLEGVTELEMIQTMETSLVLGDIGKSEKAREFFKPYGAAAPDHDDFHEEVMHILELHPQLCPTFDRLSPAAKKLLCQTANLAHFGHITHLEGGPSMFSKLKQSGLPASSPLALSFDLFVHTCDVAGALGHVNNQSSMVYTEPTHQAMQAMAKACFVLSDPQKNEMDAYNSYLGQRADWLGLNSHDGTDRVLTRIAAMLRLFSPEDGILLKQSFLKLNPEQRIKVIDTEEGEDFARTPTYVPAVLVNLSNNSQLGASKEERISQTVVLGLPFLSKVFDKHKKDIAENKANPNVPLNFNKVAGFAKTSPKMLLNDFEIDPEGNVYFVDKCISYEKIKAVIFDCDGVLVDTEYLKFLAWKEALASINVNFSIEDYMPVVGHSSKNILKMIEKSKELKLSDEIIEIKNIKYKMLQKQGVPAIQPMVDFVCYLSKNKEQLGLLLGLASSAPKEEILVNLHQIGLENVFDEIISGSDDLDHYVDSEGTNKPKPYIYMEAAKRLNIAPEFCLVFEDTEAGVVAAADAAMVAIAVPNQYTLNQDFSKATLVLKNHKELPFMQTFHLEALKKQRII